MQDTVFGYLQQFFGLLTSVQGILCILAALFILVLLGVVPKARWFVLGLLLLIATFSTGADEAISEIYQAMKLPFPLNTIAEHARVLEILIGFSLLVPLARSVKGWRTRIVPGPLIAFFALNLWMCFRLFSDEYSVARGTLSLISYVLLFLTLGIGIGRSLQSFGDAYALLKSSVGVAVAFAVANIYYVVRNPASSTGRFMGITSNPQGVGQFVALLLPPLLCMAQIGTARFLHKVVLWATAGFLVIFLLWSGSRTGVIMSAIGVSFFYRAQLKRAMFGLTVGVLVSVGAILLFPQSMANISRFSDPTNTRADAWANLITLFKQNPIIGVTFQGTGYGESLYLATLANYGVVGAIPLALFVITLMGALGRVFRHRRLLGPHAVLVDVLIAEMIMILALSVFESALLGVWSFVTLVLFTQCALLAFLNDEIAAALERGYADLPGAASSPSLMIQGAA